jgi:hypothetical protein
LNPVTYELGKPRDLFAVDEGHRAWLDAGRFDRRCVHMGDSIDDRVPDAHNVDLSSAELLFRGTRTDADRSRLRHESRR